MRSREQKPRPATRSAAGRARRAVVRSWRKLATVAAGAMVLGMGYHVVFGQNGLTAYEHKRAESRTLRSEATALEKENERFRGHVARLESDPGAIESQAREELHYARPGEVIIAIPTDTKTVPAPAAR